MSTLSAPTKTVSSGIAPGGWLTGDRWILVVHVAALLLNLPLLAIYFRELMQQPHYQFAPFVLAFAAMYIYVRRSEFSRIRFSARGVWANAFLLLALPFVLFANLRFDPEFAGIGCFFIAASLLARTRDRETGESMLPLAFALALIVRLPFGLDNRMITGLQRLTSQIASRVLDLFGVNHLLSGNVIRMENRPFMVEEACGGIQSFFLLLFCALAWVAWSRRGLLRSILLIMAAVAWAIICNSARVLTICASHAWWNVDLASGIPHVLTGYFFMFLAIGLLISTDFLLEFMFGRGEALENVRRSRLSIVLFGGRHHRAESSSTGILPLMVSKPLIFCGCLLLAVVAVIPLFAAGPAVLYRQLTKKYVVREVSAAALPEAMNVSLAQGGNMDWTREKYEVEQRERNSEWGSRSSRWVMKSSNFSPPMELTISLDYPFSGWHELTGCYRGNGWVMEKREILASEFAPDWHVVVGRFRLPTGLNGLLMFSMFDEDGQPVQTVVDDVRRMNFIQRSVAALQKRLNKEYGPLPQTYQVQVFIDTVEELNDDAIKVLLENYVRFREMIRHSVVPSEQ